jgi:hypothetical protein
MDSNGDNYDPLAEYMPDCFGANHSTVCICHYQGCMDSLAPNYDSFATVPVSPKECVADAGSGDDCGQPVAFGGCEIAVPGCTYSQTPNYDPTANVNDGSCYMTGCTIPSAVNYASYATDPAFCDMSQTGCIDSDAINYDPEKTVQGTTDCGPYPAYYETYLICTLLQEKTCTIIGCGDVTALNYESKVTISIESACVYPDYGCTDPAAADYNLYANTDDGTCSYRGCTDSTRVGYDPVATFDYVNVSSPLYEEDDPTTAYDERYISTCFGFTSASPAPPPLSSTYTTAKMLLGPCDDAVVNKPSACSTPDYCVAMNELLGDAESVLIAGSVSLLTTGANKISRTEGGVTYALKPQEIYQRYGCTASQRRGRSLDSHDKIDYALDIEIPEGYTIQTLLEALREIPPDRWSEELGVPVSGLVFCWTENGVQYCSFPPPTPPPALPEPFGPPPSGPPSGSSVPVLIIVIVVIVVLIIVLLIVGFVLFRRRKKRVESSAISPGDPQRAVVQPPPLPAANTYADRVPQNPPVGAGTPPPLTSDTE